MSYVMMFVLDLVVHWQTVGVYLIIISISIINFMCIFERIKNIVAHILFLTFIDVIFLFKVVDNYL